MTFLRGAAERPHHAYVFAGPEGSGKSLAARAFAAALLCATGVRRVPRLPARARATSIRTSSSSSRRAATSTSTRSATRSGSPPTAPPPEPGRKVFLVREADRLSPAAADTLLKVLEEPPPDTVLPAAVGAGARAARDDLEPVPRRDLRRAARAVRGRTARGRGRRRRPGHALAARLAGGNLGRARRMATDDDGLAFRDVAAPALALGCRGAGGGACRPPTRCIAAAADHKKGLGRELDAELAPFLDEKGRPEEAYRGVDPADRDPVPPPGAPSRTRPSRPRAAGGVVLVTRRRRRRDRGVGRGPC